ncbi:MAG TPA: isochorismatase family cysteine hydrolase [Longimicrobiales bacterium]|nr:isochorismatase family cysteine hydrolase [Longimicrobiales bacterium]
MKPVFLFVDLLEDFFARPPHSTRRRELVDAANELASIAREAAAPIIWVRQEFEPDLSDAFLAMRRTGRRVTIRGTPGCHILAELDRRPEDHEIVKKRYSAFFNTGLAELLDSLGCTHTVICGVNTHACVRATAIDAYQRDFHVLLAREAIASYDDEFHRESMRYLEQSIGTAMSNAELRELLREATAGRP